MKRIDFYFVPKEANCASCINSWRLLHRRYPFLYMQNALFILTSIRFPSKYIHLQSDKDLRMVLQVEHFCVLPL